MDHTSDPSAMRYVIDPSRLDLVEEFRASPLGVHSPELRKLLARMRWGRPEGRLVLEPGRAWRLSCIPKRRGDPMPFVDDRVFTSLAEAEWHVFKLRWQETTGATLPAEVSGDL
ncbi:hypothetical protein [Bradyrhizobium diazoefficiens]|nr:hypothetical protein XF15B_37430 [Bradyrhizobium diazoefficiens]